MHPWSDSHSDSLALRLHKLQTYSHSDSCYWVRRIQSCQLGGANCEDASSIFLVSVPTGKPPPVVSEGRPRGAHSRVDHCAVLPRTSCEHCLRRGGPCDDLRVKVRSELLPLALARTISEHGHVPWRSKSGPRKQARFCVFFRGVFGVMTGFRV